MQAKEFESSISGSGEDRTADPGKREMELYSDLLSFSELSPEQQRMEIEWLTSSGVNISSERMYSSESDSNELEDSITLHPEESYAQPAASHQDVRAVEAATASPLSTSGPLHITGALGYEHLSPNSEGAQQVVCSVCGSRSSAKDLFCIMCGHFIEEFEI